MKMAVIIGLSAVAGALSAALVPLADTWQIGGMGAAVGILVAAVVFRIWGDRQCGP